MEEHGSLTSYFESIQNVDETPYANNSLHRHSALADVPAHKRVFINIIRYFAILWYFDIASDLQLLLYLHINELLSSPV